MPTFTRSNLKTALNGRIHNKAGILSDINTTIENAVREVISVIDFRSMKRKSTVAPDLFDDIYQYNCPTDLKTGRIVSISPQDMNRSFQQYWELVGQDEFDRRKQTDKNLISFSDDSLVTKLLISADVTDKSVTISDLDSLTASGTWAAFGDATNLSIDNYQFIKGNAAIKFDLSAAGGTTAGIQSSTLSTFDLTDYKSAGSVFVWAWVTSATNLTNYKLRVGNSSSNYYEMTVTTTNEGVGFATGWNLLRFDLSGKTTTGTVTDTTCAYAAIYMTKTAGKISETGYRFDYLVLKLGEINNLTYFSEYPWQSSAGTWKLQATADSDYLNCGSDEYQIILEKVVEHASSEIREDADMAAASKKFDALVKSYTQFYRSEALQTQDTYYNF